MAVAGWCKVCQQHVWLDERWGCVNGHPWTEISDWYDPADGSPVTPYWLQPAPEAQPVAAVESQPEPAAQPQPAPVAAVEPAPVTAPAVAQTTRLELLAAILELLSQYPTYRSHYGTDTDIVIDNQVADAVWAGGKKKVEYEAILKAVEAEKTVYFWELLKEKSAGISFGGFESESYSTVGMRRSGTKKSATLTPDGVQAAYDWDYALTRQIVESVAIPAGWRVKVVLTKGSARW